VINKQIKDMLIFNNMTWTGVDKMLILELKAEDIDFNLNWNVTINKSVSSKTYDVLCACFIFNYWRHPLWGFNYPYFIWNKLKIASLTYKPYEDFVKRNLPHTKEGNEYIFITQNK